MSKTETRISAHWSYYGQDWRAKRDQLLRFVDALATIHPLLKNFSEKGKRSGWLRLLRQPELHVMTDAQWQEVLRYEDLFLFRHVCLWNRRKTDQEALIATIHYADPVPDTLGSFGGCGISIPDLPEALLIEPILMAMLEATITAFQPDHADIGTYFRVGPSIDKSTKSETELAIIGQRATDIRRSDMAEWRERYKALEGGADTPVWRLWIALGQPWPKPGSSWLESWQSEPADEEVSCLGGTLYTWHKYAPWTLPDEVEWKR